MQYTLENQPHSIRDIDTIRTIITPKLVKVMSDFINAKYDELRDERIDLENPLVDIFHLITTSCQKLGPFVNQADYVFRCLKVGNQRITQDSHIDTEELSDVDTYCLQCFYNDDDIQKQFQQNSGLSDDQMDLLLDAIMKCIDDDSDESSESEDDDFMTEERLEMLLQYATIAAQRDMLKRASAPNAMNLANMHLNYYVSKLLVEIYNDKYKIWASTVEDINILTILNNVRLNTVDNELDAMYLKVLMLFADYYEFDNQGQAIFDLFQKEVCSTPRNIVRFLEAIKYHPVKGAFCDAYRDYCDRMKIQYEFDIDSVKNPKLYIGFDGNTENNKYYARVLEEKTPGNNEQMYVTLSTLYTIFRNEGWIGDNDERELFVFRLSGLFDQELSDAIDFHTTDKIVWEASATELALVFYYLFTPSGATGDSPPYAKVGGFFSQPNGEGFKDLPGLSKSARNTKKNDKNQHVVTLLKKAGFNINIK